MAASKSVIVLAPNGRRQTVKVTPNTTILQILEQVCQKHGYETEEYDIKHYNRVLDANAIFRFTGLPNNAQLEMVPCTKKRLDSNVMVGIQTESGDRVTGEFQPSNSLAQVLNQLCPDQMLPTAALIYMHREVCGLDLLEQTTLRSLGLNCGRAMLRLIHRDPEQPRTQAHVSAPLAARPSQENIDLARRMAETNRQTAALRGGAQKNIDPISVLKTGKTVQHHTQASVSEKIPKLDCDLKVEEKTDVTETENTGIPMDTSESSIEESKVEFLGDRNALVFNQAGAEALPRNELPDNFFDLTVEDARHLLKDAIRLRAELDEAPLLTSAQRQLDENKRILHHLHKYRKTVIRIQFPDQLVLQGLFGPLETVQAVKEFVKIYLANPDAEFMLYTTPPRTVLDPGARLVDANLVPSAILHYSGQSSLKSELNNKLTDPRVAGIQAVKSRMAMARRGVDSFENEDIPDISMTQENRLERVVETPKQSEPTPGPSHRNLAHATKANVPKWFKQPFK
ncbi:tether containing UBX domain for GLUT4 [Neodiprion virginianus]|uniref:tether containing UBX domain for GLUT4 n=1 Tax=Neodiprion virginianus TaxID=2961670 RepID=UPI001EE75397|nr:tether containing UBX domain for GLUT4 [Neodiprion virginianus]